MDNEEIVISIKCEQGDIKRRFRLRGRNYTDLYANLAAQFSSGLNIFWKDDEDDLIIMNSPESLEEAHTEDLIRLVVKEQRNSVENKEIPVQTEPVTGETLNEINQQPIPPSSRTTGAAHNATCDICDVSIIGHRFKCLICADYDLCASCESTGAHATHAMMRTVDVNAKIPWGLPQVRPAEPKANAQQQNPWAIPPKTAWNSPNKSTDEKLKEITMNGLNFLAGVGSAVTDTLANFGIDATYEVRGGGGRPTGRKDPIPCRAPPPKKQTEDKEKKDDKKESVESEKKEEKKAEPVKEKKAEKVEEKKAEPVNPFLPAQPLYPSLQATGLIGIPAEKKITKSSEPIVTREQAKLSSKTESSRKKTSRLEEEVAKAKEKKYQDWTRDRDYDADWFNAERRTRGFGTGFYGEYDDSDYRSAPRQTKRAIRKREEVYGRSAESFGDHVHGTRCSCTACTQRLGFGGRRADFPTGDFGAPRFGSGGFGSAGFGSSRVQPAPPTRSFGAFDAAPIPRGSFESVPIPRGNFGIPSNDFGRSSFYGRSRSPTYPNGFADATMCDCGCNDVYVKKQPVKETKKSDTVRAFEGQSAFQRGNPDFGKTPASAFGEPNYVEDEEARKTKDESNFEIEKTPAAFVAHYEPSEAKEEKKEPVKEVEEKKAVDATPVHASVLIPLLEEIGERVDIAIEQERQADFFVAPNEQTYIGDGKMSCDEAMGVSETYENKSTDQESIGSEVVAVEDVDSDGWVDAKDSDDIIANLTRAMAIASLPTAPIDDTPANQLNVDGTFATLLSMGYSDQQARRAISHCGCDLENCIDYISQQ